MEETPWDGLTYPELAAEMERLKNAHSDAKAAAAAVWKEYSQLAQVFIPRKMDDEQIQNITVTMPDGSNKRLQVSPQCSVSTPPENKAALWDWLKENGAEHLITGTVNSSSLAAFVRERISQGEETPNDICNIKTYETASLVKA